MQQDVSSEEKRRETVEQKSSTAGTKKRKGPTGLHFFARWKPEDQLKAFWAWLPTELHDAPGIDWTMLAPDIMGYFVRTVGHSPDAAVLAVAAAVCGQ